MNIKGYELVLTCGACPEQYDVFKDGKQVGYLRLRHGFFSVECPDACGTLVYETEPRGDGSFYPDERRPYLNRAIEEIRRYWEGQQPATE